MNNKGVKFTPPGAKSAALPVKPNTLNNFSAMTRQLSEFNRPKCTCGKSKTGYCDGSHSKQ